MAKSEMDVMLKIIMGPPLAGKSTYIKNNAQPGDLIIDLDRIALALLPENTPDHLYDELTRKIAMDARDAALNRAITISNRKNVWVIHSTPTPARLRQYLAYQADLIYINTSKQDCLKRLASRHPDTHHRARVAINNYTPPEVKTTIVNN